MIGAFSHAITIGLLIGLAIGLVRMGLFPAAGELTLKAVIWPFSFAAGVYRNRADLLRTIGWLLFWLALVMFFMFVLGIS